MGGNLEMATFDSDDTDYLGAPDGGPGGGKGPQMFSWDFSESEDGHTLIFRRAHTAPLFMKSLPAIQPVVQCQGWFKLNSVRGWPALVSFSSD